MWDALRMRRVRAIASGRVQGVSYRASTTREARRLCVTGWVRNRPDGTVELEAEGPPEQIAALLAWCQRGPSFARVTTVVVEDLPPTGADTAFSVARGP